MWVESDKWLLYHNIANLLLLIGKETHIRDLCIEAICHLSAITVQTENSHNDELRGKQMVEYIIMSRVCSCSLKWKTSSEMIWGMCNSKTFPILICQYFFPKLLWQKRWLRLDILQLNSLIPLCYQLWMPFVFSRYEWAHGAESHRQTEVFETNTEMLQTLLVSVSADKNSNRRTAVVFFNWDVSR